MAAGIGSKDQSQWMIHGYLNHPSKFGGEFGLPSVTRTIQRTWTMSTGEEEYAS